MTQLGIIGSRCFVLLGSFLIQIVPSFTDPMVPRSGYAQKLLNC